MRSASDRPGLNVTWSTISATDRPDGIQSRSSDTIYLFIICPQKRKVGVQNSYGVDRPPSDVNSGQDVNAVFGDQRFLSADVFRGGGAGIRDLFPSVPVQFLQNFVKLP